MKKGGIPLEVLSFILAEIRRPMRPEEQFGREFITPGFIWLSLPLHAVGAGDRLASR